MSRTLGLWGASWYHLRVASWFSVGLVLILVLAASPLAPVAGLHLAVERCFEQARTDPLMGEILLNAGASVTVTYDELKSLFNRVNSDKRPDRVIWEPMFAGGEAVELQVQDSPDAKPDPIWVELMPLFSDDKNRSDPLFSGKTFEDVSDVGVSSALWQALRLPRSKDHPYPILDLRCKKTEKDDADSRPRAHDKEPPDTDSFPARFLPCKDESRISLRVKGEVSDTDAPGPTVYVHRDTLRNLTKLPAPENYIGARAHVREVEDLPSVVAALNNNGFEVRSHREHLADLIHLRKVVSNSLFSYTLRVSLVGLVVLPWIFVAVYLRQWQREFRELALLGFSNRQLTLIPMMHWLVIVLAGLGGLVAMMAAWGFFAPAALGELVARCPVSGNGETAGLVRWYFARLGAVSIWEWLVLALLLVGGVFAYRALLCRVTDLGRDLG